MALNAKDFLKKIFLYVFLIFSIFFSSTMYAAELNLSPAQGSYAVGDTIKVRIVLSSPSQSANAVSGSLSFSKDTLSLTSISKSNSLVSLWAVEPSYSNTSGTADMEGVILSGYTGSNGTILTLTFKAKDTGTASIKFRTSSVLANDGQGSNILTSAGQASYTITAAKATPVVVKNDAPAPTTSTLPNIHIEEIKKKDVLDLHARFLVSSTGKKSKTIYHVELDDVPAVWDNQTNNIFETPNLIKGTHTIKVYAEANDGSIISSTLTFNISSLLVPAFTDYSKELKENEFLVVKGLADPNTNISIDVEQILSDGSTIPNEATMLKSDDKGLFTYVSENRTTAGEYSITAQAKSQSGVYTDKSLPAQISVKPVSASVSVNVMNVLSAVIPIVALIVLLIIMMIWGWNHILHYREYMRKRLNHTKDLVSKSFSILNEDVAEEVKILKKVKALEPLSKDERAFITQLQKDMDQAEKTILSDIKDSEK
jgi:hypothetical protein